MEEIKRTSEELLTALNNLPRHYLPKQVYEAMLALRSALKTDRITSEARDLVDSIDQNTEAVPHRIVNYVDNLQNLLAS